MSIRKPRSNAWQCWSGISIGIALVAGTLRGVGGADQPTPVDSKNEYAAVVQPLVKKYCLHCHSTKAKKGSLDLERFTSLDHVRKDLKPWQALIEMLETNEMPPKTQPQPTAEERKGLIAWIRSFLDAEARARAGDP